MVDGDFARCHKRISRQRSKQRRQADADNGAGPLRLLTDIETLDEIGVALTVLEFQIVEQAAPSAYQHQQSASRMVIFRVGLEVIGQVVNALAEDCDLHLGGTGVRLGVL